MQWIGLNGTMYSKFDVGYRMINEGATSETPIQIFLFAG